MSECLRQIYIVVQPYEWMGRVVVRGGEQARDREESGGASDLSRGGVIANCRWLTSYREYQDESDFVATGSPAMLI
jgi:hypothetical protein